MAQTVSSDSQILKLQGAIAREELTDSAIEAIREVQALLINGEDYCLELDSSEIVPAIAARLVTMGFLSERGLHVGSDKIKLSEIERNIDFWEAGTRAHHHSSDLLKSTLQALVDERVVLQKRGRDVYSLNQNSSTIANASLADWTDSLIAKLPRLHKKFYPQTESASEVREGSPETASKKVPSKEKKPQTHASHPAEKKPSMLTHLEEHARRIRQDLSAMSKTVKQDLKIVSADNKDSSRIPPMQRSLGRFLHNVAKGHEALRKANKRGCRFPFTKKWIERELTAHVALLDGKKWHRGSVPKVDQLATMLEHVHQYSQKYPDRRTFFKQASKTIAITAVTVPTTSVAIAVGMSYYEDRQEIGTPKNPAYTLKDTYRSYPVVAIHAIEDQYVDHLIQNNFMQVLEDQAAHREKFIQSVHSLTKGANVSSLSELYDKCVPSDEVFDSMISKTIELIQIEEGGEPYPSHLPLSRALLKAQFLEITGKHVSEYIMPKKPSKVLPGESRDRYAKDFVRAATIVGANVSTADGGTMSRFLSRFKTDNKRTVRDLAAGYLFAHALISSIEDDQARDMLSQEWAKMVFLAELKVLKSELRQSNSKERPTLHQASVLASSMLREYPDAKDAYRQLVDPERTSEMDDAAIKAQYTLRHPMFYCEKEFDAFHNATKKYLQMLEDEVEALESPIPSIYDYQLHDNFLNMNDDNGDFEF